MKTNLQAYLAVCTETESKESGKIFQVDIQVFISSKSPHY